MCSLCETVKGNSNHFAHIGSDVYQKRPYPFTELDMVLHLNIAQKDNSFFLVADGAAFGGARLKKDRLSANAKVVSQIYYCPYCGEKL